MAARSWRTAVLALALSVFGCGGGGGGGGGDGLSSADAGGSGDAGTSGPEDAGDAGPSDAAPVVEPAPTSGWTYYGAGEGGPRLVFGVTADEGGNIWVAGGEEGLFLLRAGSARFERFTLDHGLRPYGSPYAGQGPVTAAYLNVASVSGGPAGTVFVGYLGMPAGAGAYECEDNWDGPNPDPNIYKSGDADRVTLTSGGLEVSHYDISSGPNAVAAEPRGREKICHVYRILYDGPSRSVWFGGNHAYAWGDPNSTRVMEHAHPLHNGYAREDATDEYALTNYYWGLAVEPGGGLWVGGHFRSQHCPAGFAGEGFWTCEAEGAVIDLHYDWWADAVKADSRPSQRVNDAVSGMAVGTDGSVWVGSFNNGLARRWPDGRIELLGAGLVDPKRISSVKADPADGSIWIGATGGGLTRIKDGKYLHYDSRVFGDRAAGAVPDIQVAGAGASRRMLVGFRSGSIGIYTGP